ncbi:MAG: UPF0149 family protein [Pseudazoarcus pumilus]|nr:UPF0149 family protein [Pseudazoarcus pumilus]
MTDETPNPHELSDDEFDALEEILTSDAVPDDCMNLEMLDGYLAAVVISPLPLEAADWMPAVWSAHEDASFASGSGMQQAIRLVLRYYNELLTTVGAPDGWEPFCYAGSTVDDLAVGEEWIEGFLQGLELWPTDWAGSVPHQDAEIVTETLQSVIRPWESADDEVPDSTRLEWLNDAREAVTEIRARWLDLELAQPEPVATEMSVATATAPGRNEQCPCGSGKKFKKCCGANV